METLSHLNYTKDGKKYIAIQGTEETGGGCSMCEFNSHVGECNLSERCSLGAYAYYELEAQPVKDTEPSAGIKYDQDKVDFTLIPPYALLAVAKNLTAGLKKYKERDNWKKVPEAKERYMKALYRHLEAIRRGEIFDPDALEPNTTHMSAVIANAMFLQEFMDNPELKD
jgi:hypothetical protein